VGHLKAQCFHERNGGKKLGFTFGERLLNAEPWVECEVQLPLHECNLGVMSGARKKQTHPTLLRTQSLHPLDPQRWS